MKLLRWTVADKARSDLEEARKGLYEARASAEYHSFLVAFYSARIARLEAQVAAHPTPTFPHLEAVK